MNPISGIYCYIFFVRINFILIIYKKKYLIFLDIVSISNDNFGTIVIKEDKLFDGPIFDIKSSNLNGNYIFKFPLFILNKVHLISIILKYYFYIYVKFCIELHLFLELIIRQKTKLVIFSNSFDTGTLLNNNSVHDNCGIPIADFDTLNNNICTADVKHVIKILKDR